jgi:hypothetical protein
MMENQPARFRLSVISILVLLAAISARSWMYFQVAGKQPLTPYQAGTFIGYVLMGAILAPLFFSWLAWLVFRRSSTAATIVFCLATCLLNLLAWDKNSHLHAGLEQLDKARQNLVSSMRETMKNPVAGPAAAVDQLKSYSRKLGEATSQMQGREKLAGEAGQRFYRLLTAKMQGYSTAVQALQKEGFGRAKGINTRADLQHRRELVQAFARANQDVADFYTNAENIFRGELQKENLDSGYIGQVLEGFRKSASIDLVLKVRKCDAEIVDQTNKMLDLYDREWRTWRVEDSGKVIFVNPAAVDEFQAAQNAIKDIAARQKAFQDQILQNAQAAK